MTDSPTFRNRMIHPGHFRKQDELESPRYFGVDVGRIMQEFFDGVFVPLTVAANGDKPFVVMVLDDRKGNDDSRRSISCDYGDTRMIIGPEGLYANVKHKLNFVLRTGMNSSEARSYPHLVEPGDFPYGGAGRAYGFVGGCSGFSEEQDWKVFLNFANKLREVRSAAACAAIKACEEGVPGMKYLMGGASDSA